MVINGEVFRLTAHEENDMFKHIDWLQSFGIRMDRTLYTGGFVDGKYAICNKPLTLGRFAYNQEECWDCFERQVESIARDTKTLKGRSYSGSYVRCYEKNASYKEGGKI